MSFTLDREQSDKIETLAAKFKTPEFRGPLDYGSDRVLYFAVDSGNAAGGLILSEVISVGAATQYDRVDYGFSFGSKARLLHIVPAVCKISVENSVIKSIITDTVQRRIDTERILTDFVPGLFDTVDTILKGS